MPTSKLIALALLLGLASTARATDAPGRRGSPARAQTSGPSAALPGGELQRTILAARDAVLPALVHVEPIVALYQRGQKAKAALTGSGFIVDEQGHVLTNDHVVANAQRVTCVLYDQRELTAKVVGRDPFTDVAVLQLDLGGKAVPVAQLGSSEALTAGQYVIAMGSPLGLARSISAGVVSTPERYLPEDVLPSGGITGAYNTWIQTDAAINPGNSGGPLVDLRGHVVGINARAVPIFGENLGFAIPIDVVKDVAGQLIEHGKVNRSWIGVRWQHLKSLAGYFGAEERGGVLVGSLVPDGPAARAGIAAGDVVTAIDGQGVSARFEEELPRFRKRIADLPVGSRVRLAALRRGTEIAFDVVTEEHPETESQETELESWGFTARDVTPDLARRRRIKSLEGALVTGVKPAAPATVAGLDEGDVVREVDGTRVKDTKHLVEVLRELEQQRKKQVLVKVDRGSTLHVMLIEPER